MSNYQSYVNYVNKRRQNFFSWLAGAALLLGVVRQSYAPASWGTITEISAPSGLSSSQNLPVNDTANDNTLRLEIYLDQDATLSRVSSTPFTNTATGETLATTYMFTTDGSGRNGSGVPINGSTRAQGRDNFVSLGEFLTPGVPLIYDTRPPDTTSILEVTSRGRNPEDYGLNNDLTEAPDIGSYESSLVLRLTTVP